MSGRGGFVQCKRGGFQAKKWVKNGTAGAMPAPATVDVKQQPLPPECGQLSIFVGNLDPSVAADNRGGFQAKKWFKPRTVGATSAPAAVGIHTALDPEQRPPPPEHGRLSIFVGNLDPSVAEDKLRQFFWQAG